MSTILLAEGQIAPSDRLAIELVEALETPPAILLRWPTQPSLCDPAKLAAVANRVMAILAAAAGRLATVQTDVCDEVILVTGA